MADWPGREPGCGVVVRESRKVARVRIQPEDHQHPAVLELSDVVLVRAYNVLIQYENLFILDSRRVLAPKPKGLGPKHISNPDFAPFLTHKKRGVL